MAPFVAKPMVKAKPQVDPRPKESAPVDQGKRVPRSPPRRRRDRSRGAAPPQPDPLPKQRPQLALRCAGEPKPPEHQPPKHLTATASDADAADAYDEDPSEFDEVPGPSEAQVQAFKDWEAQQDPEALRELGMRWYAASRD